MLAAPFWYIASRKLRKFPSGRAIPVMALVSAFCFVIQMINIPLPGGTTGHAAGASLAAVVLTPWPAVLTVSIALVIQALFFGDGGITAIGANCFNMAIAQVFTAYYIYRMIPAASARGKSFAAAVAGYVSLNVAGLLAGIELGLQPALSHTPDGTPLYAPYPFSVAIPAMVAGHLVAGIAEAVVTGTALSFLVRSAPELMQMTTFKQEPLPLFWARLRILWLVLGVLTILTPLGLLAPGTPWGEWSTEQLHDVGLDFIPAGFQRLNGFWKAVFADYSFPGVGENAGTILSAVTGIALIVCVFWIITVMGKKKAQV